MNDTPIPDSGFPDPFNEAHRLIGELARAIDDWGKAATDEVNMGAGVKLNKIDRKTTYNETLIAVKTDPARKVTDETAKALAEQACFEVDKSIVKDEQLVDLEGVNKEKLEKKISLLKANLDIVKSALFIHVNTQRLTLPLQEDFPQIGEQGIDKRMSTGV